MGKWGYFLPSSLFWGHSPGRNGVRRGGGQRARSKWSPHGSTMPRGPSHPRHTKQLPLHEMDREGERRKNFLHFSRKACQLLKKHRKRFWFFCYLPILYPVFSHFSGGPQVVHTSFFNIFKGPGAIKLKKTFWGRGNGVTFQSLFCGHSPGRKGVGGRGGGAGLE